MVRSRDGVVDLGGLMLPLSIACTPRPLVVAPTKPNAPAGVQPPSQPSATGSTPLQPPTATPPQERLVSYESVADVRAACDGGDSAACLLAATWYQQGGVFLGEEVARDAGAYERLARLACQTGSGLACAMLAMDMVDQNGSLRDDSAGSRKVFAEYLRKACLLEPSQASFCTEADAAVAQVKSGDITGLFSHNLGGFVLGMSAQEAKETCERRGGVFVVKDKRAGCSPVPIDPFGGALIAVLQFCGSTVCEVDLMFPPRLADRVRGILIKKYGDGGQVQGHLGAGHCSRAESLRPQRRIHWAARPYQNQPFGAVLFTDECTPDGKRHVHLFYRNKAGVERAMEAGRALENAY